MRRYWDVSDPTFSYMYWQLQYFFSHTFVLKGLESFIYFLKFLCTFGFPPYMYCENLYFFKSLNCTNISIELSLNQLFTCIGILKFIKFDEQFFSKHIFKLCFDELCVFFNLSVMTEEGRINVLIYINTNVSKERSNGLFRSTLTLSLLLSKHIKTSHCQFTCKIGKNKVCLFKVS